MISFGDACPERNRVRREVNYILGSTPWDIESGNTNPSIDYLPTASAATSLNNGNFSPNSENNEYTPVRKRLHFILSTDEIQY